MPRCFPIHNRLEQEFERELNYTRSFSGLNDCLRGRRRDRGATRRAKRRRGDGR